MGKPQELGIASLYFLYSFVSSSSQKFVKTLELCLSSWLFLFQALSLLGLLLLLLWLHKLALYWTFALALDSLFYTLFKVIISLLIQLPLRPGNDKKTMELVQKL